jgi:hypothetical protein
MLVKYYRCNEGRVNTGSAEVVEVGTDERTKMQVRAVGRGRVGTVKHSLI